MNIKVGLTLLLFCFFAFGFCWIIIFRLVFASEDQGNMVGATNYE